MTDVELLEELLPCENNLVIVPEPHISSKNPGLWNRWLNTPEDGFSGICRKSGDDERDRARDILVIIEEHECPTGEANGSFYWQEAKLVSL
jgi:hypothetical protein